MINVFLLILFEYRLNIFDTSFFYQLFFIPFAYYFWDSGIQRRKPQKLNKFLHFKNNLQQPWNILYYRLPLFLCCFLGVWTRLISNHFLYLVFSLEVSQKKDLIPKNTQQTSFKNSQQNVYSKAVGKHFAEIFKHFKGARNRVGIGLSYRPAGYTA